MAFRNNPSSRRVARKPCRLSAICGIRGPIWSLQTVVSSRRIAPTGLTDAGIRGSDPRRRSVDHLGSSDDRRPCATGPPRSHAGGCAGAGGAGRGVGGRGWRGGEWAGAAGEGGGAVERRLCSGVGGARAGLRSGTDRGKPCTPQSKSALPCMRDSCAGGGGRSGYRHPACSWPRPGWVLGRERGTGGRCAAPPRSRRRPTRPRAAGYRRRGRLPPAATGLAGGHHRRDRPRRGSRPGARPRRGGRRLPGEAVRAGGAARAHPCRAAARPAGRDRRDAGAARCCGTGRSPWTCGRAR